jgi:hypothetical protein
VVQVSTSFNICWYDELYFSIMNFKKF